MSAGRLCLYGAGPGNCACRGGVASDLAAADVALAPLELGAARVGEDVVRIPDLIGLEQLLEDAGLL